MKVVPTTSGRVALGLGGRQVQTNSNVSDGDSVAEFESFLINRRE